MSEELGIGRITSIVIGVVVVAAVIVAIYFLTAPKPTYTLSVAPSTSLATNGSAIGFRAFITPSANATRYTWFFGDGTNETTAQPFVTHTYTRPGTYLVYVEAVVNGITVDNHQSLLPITITANVPSSAQDMVSIPTLSLSNNTINVGTPVRVYGGFLLPPLQQQLDHHPVHMEPREWDDPGQRRELHNLGPPRQ